MSAWKCTLLLLLLLLLQTKRSARALALASLLSLWQTEPSVLQSFQFAPSWVARVRCELQAFERCPGCVQSQRHCPCLSGAGSPEEYRQFAPNVLRLRSNDSYGKVNRFKKCRHSIRYRVIPIVRMAQTYQPIANPLDGHVHSGPRDRKTVPHAMFAHSTAFSVL